MPLQQTVVPQGHGIESRRRLGGTPAAERQSVSHTMSLDKHSCMTRAKALLSAPTAENLRYAALELRLCMEAITYEASLLRATHSRVCPANLAATSSGGGIAQLEPDADRSHTSALAPRKRMVFRLRSCR